MRAIRNDQCTDSNHGSRATASFLVSVSPAPTRALPVLVGWPPRPSLPSPFRTSDRRTSEGRPVAVGGSPRRSRQLAAGRLRPNGRHGRGAGLPSWRVDVGARPRAPAQRDRAAVRDCRFGRPGRRIGILARTGARPDYGSRINADPRARSFPRTGSCFAELPAGLDLIQLRDLLAGQTDLPLEGLS